MSLIFLVLFLAGISKGLCSQAVDHWGYPKEERDGVVRENENWGGECDTGRRQSPIDLDHDASVKGHFSELMFAGYEEPIENAAVTNTGHSIQINVGAPKHVILGGGGLPGSYHFDQMHFHWGSEHTINDKRYALELHMVHHESRFPTIADAAQIKRGIAVLGILFHISADPNPYLDNIIEAAENVGDVMGKSKVLEEQLSPINLLPKHRSQYFRYEGSLTTPGCGEAVIWTIFPDSLPISMDQYEKFKTMIKGEDGTLSNNFRSLQPLNSRPLVYVSSDVESYDGNSSSVISYSLFLIIILQMAVYVHLR